MIRLCNDLSYLNIINCSCMLLLSYLEIYNENDPNRIFDLIQKKYGKHYHETKTTKTYKTRSNRVKRDPWVTAELLPAMRKRDRLAKMKERQAEYKKLRNEIVAKLRKLEKDYLQIEI